jgi:hypothetical protein
VRVIEGGSDRVMRSSFEQSHLRAPSTQKKYTVEMVDDIPNTVALEPIIKEK